jgi:hypothetical protein
MNPSIMLASVPINIQNCHLSDTHPSEVLPFEPSCLFLEVLDIC